ncbi:hypothetical protein DYBT9623_04691 [Dyadobacter sp. CECT 9623]|uniref:DUF3500 domain-containing protein n=1 Tax=Dyadobacter linearis TaxID=2823330 RepID=A0ABN7RHK9_9BACT|nr:DUF3500 domain-containing protein [Dyadobacter sp. CECT 9623]CAG5073188.1 hypothetical protein DYBT9623_04691 [Dyadobacter sp. CECT 9623]
MKRIGFKAGLCILFFVAGIAASNAGNRILGPGKDEKLAKEMALAVNAFIKLLDAGQQKDAILPYSDPMRFDWNFTPRDRKGISLKQMDAAQRKAAMALIKVVLSQEGYSKAEQIIDLENVLRVVETRPANDTYRDPENYAFLVFGKPGNDPWGWRVEGHHISLHFSSINNHITYTPSFMGSNPGKVLADVPQKGKVILKAEQETAFKLLNSLDKSQQEKASLGAKAPNEIFTSNTRKASLEKMEGIPMRDLNATQKAIFKDLIMAYLQRYHVTLKSQQWAELEKAGLENIHFAWMGDREPLIGPGHGHYYRIHAPTFLIEFDNTQNGGNHIHTVVRDLTNDFGEDMLRAHYEKGHR